MQIFVEPFCILLVHGSCVFAAFFQKLLHETEARVFQHAGDPARVLFGQEGRPLCLDDQIKPQIRNRPCQILRDLGLEFRRA